MTTTDQPSEDQASEDHTAEDVVLPVLLRAARGAYSQAIRRRLGEDFDDVPRNGPFVLGGMANQGGSAGDLVRALGVSKQAASQLVDVLVLRGYLQRRPDPDDRRRTALDLTDAGRAVGAAVRAGVQDVDDELTRRLGADGVAALRAGLWELASIKGGE